MANGDNLIKDAIDNTVNTAGYLWYNNTATIYTLLFAFLFGSTLLKLNCQNVIRISREKIGNAVQSMLAYFQAQQEKEISEELDVSEDTTVYNSDDDSVDTIDSTDEQHDTE